MEQNKKRIINKPLEKKLSKQSVITWEGSFIYIDRDKKEHVCEMTMCRFYRLNEKSPLPENLSSTIFVVKNYGKKKAMFILDMPWGLYPLIYRYINRRHIEIKYRQFFYHYPKNKILFNPIVFYLPVSFIEEHNLNLNCFLLGTNINWNLLKIEIQDELFFIKNELKFQYLRFIISNNYLISVEEQKIEKFIKIVEDAKNKKFTK